MLTRFLLTSILVVLPTLASAAYQNPTVVTNERQPNGSTRMVLQFTGNNGEPVVAREFTIVANTTATNFRNWVHSVIAELNLMHSAASLPALQPGQIVPALAPTPPTPSAKNIWRNKVFLYDQLVGKSYAGTLATDMTALKADIEATYQAGFLDN